MKAKWLVLFATLVVASGTASADLLYDLTDGSACTGGCGTSPFGTVDLLQLDADDVMVTVTLTDGYFIDTGGPHRTFAFNITDDPALTLTNFSATEFSTGTGASGPSSPYGDFDYGIAGPAPSDLCCDVLTFDVALTTPGPLSISDFIANTDGYYFEADIYSNVTTNTGEVGADTACVSGSDCGTLTTESIPEPFSMGLVGSGLALLGLARFRSRKS